MRASHEKIIYVGSCTLKSEVYLKKQKTVELELNYICLTLRKFLREHKARIDKLLDTFRTMRQFKIIHLFLLGLRVFVFIFCLGGTGSHLCTPGSPGWS